MKIKVVLAGADFSPYSRTVVKQAKRLAQKFNARLVVSHCVVLPTAVPGTKKRAFLDAIEKRLRSVYSLGRTVKVRIAFGVPDLVLLTHGANQKTTLTVVGHRGLTGLKGAFLGSTAERLALNARGPVWIHRGPGVVSLKSALVPTDLHRSTEALLKSIKSLTAKKVLMHVHERPTPVLYYDSWVALYHMHEERAKRRLNQIRSKFKNVSLIEVRGSAPELILNHARKYDVTVMHPRKHQELFRGFGKVTARVLRNSSKPVLVMH
ncbi:MAG: universal stress protein [Oligoflexia bacterium]|nr:universal stress protein [Oligoflexia bacterium]